MLTPKRTLTALALGLILALTAAPLDAQVESRRSNEKGFVGGEGSANFLLPTRWAPYNVRDMVHSTMVSPRWIEGTDKFWYEWESTDGSTYYIVDPGRGTKAELFDHDRIAAELTRITLDPWDAQHLPIENIRFISDNILQFDVTSSQDEEVEEEAEVEEEEEQEEEGTNEREKPKKKVHHFEFNVATQTLRELEDYESPDNHPSWASVSPDGHTVIFAREHNLYMMTGDAYQEILDARRGESGPKADSADMKIEVDEVQLTTDGEIYYGWASNSNARGTLDKDREEDWKNRGRANIIWAKDSRRFATVRSDSREVGLLWVIHNTGNKRPELESYKYDMPGDTAVTQSEVWVYDLESREATKIDDDPWKDQSMSVMTDFQFYYPDSQEPRRALWASDNSNELYFTRSSRDRHRLDLLRADVTTGAVEVLIEERLNTYLEEMQRPMHRLLPNGDILWWNEQDGRGHLYVYDASGNQKARLTEGPWTVTQIVHVDEAAGVVYFAAAGREAGIDPYYNILYRVGLNGSGLRQLTPGDFDNRAIIGESGRFIVHAYSRVNTIPEIVLRNAQGQVVMNLEEADLSALFEAGWQMPEPYTVKAADGITDLYGVIYKPFDFDSTRIYPIVEYVYPGPQTEAVSKFFSTNPSEVALAQFGIIVITVGNRGGHPSRSKWYHNYGYGNLRDYGLADKKTAVEQLAQRHSFIDQDRVGIYGHSGGGFMSTAAMLVYPDFFDVAVSSAGNHTNDIYNRWWSETHHGVKEVTKGDTVSFEYSIATNPQVAKNLKGHLLLATGDVDNNVHPANTIRMAEALIKANKRFDFFLFPGQRHGFGDMTNYFFWLRAEYFVKHLLGDSQWDVDIAQLNLESEQSR
ncbi:DPP IV N-terminal domain-containing protein [Gemmatimonadota bacterium]